jgi:hypothetical protein
MVAAATLRRHKTTHGRQAHGHMPVMLGALDPAYRTGRSIFPSRVFDPDEVQRVLKDGHQSRKIGKFVTKGPRRGWPLFTLTLEERATCPRNCKAWAFCYGNNMQAAERLTAGPALEEALWNELLRSNSRILAASWCGCTSSATSTRSTMYAFGLARCRPSRRCTCSASRRTIASPIGSALYAMVNSEWERFAIRFRV